jgi:hypothetical protein
MNRKRLLLAILSFIILASCKSYQDIRTKHLLQLTGMWENQIDSNSKRYETWSILNDSSFIGFGALIKFGDTIFRENLKMLRVNDKWYYVADVDENPEPVFFVMESIGKKGFTANNPMHDFPQTIQYIKKGKSLSAITSGSSGESIIFEFKKKR